MSDGLDILLVKSPPKPKVDDFVLQLKKKDGRLAAAAGHSQRH